MSYLSNYYLFFFHSPLSLGFMCLPFAFSLSIQALPIAPPTLFSPPVLRRRRRARRLLPDPLAPLAPLTPLTRPAPLAPLAPADPVAPSTPLTPLAPLTLPAETIGESLPSTGHSTRLRAGTFGAPSTSHSFCTEVHFEHVLLPLLKSGLLPPTSRDTLLAAHPLILHLHCSVMRLASLDFSSLRGPHPGRQQTSIAPSRVRLFLAALLHFNLSVPSLIRYLGGNHTSAWRDIPALMSYLKSMIPDHNLSDLRRVLQVGCPAVLNATTSRSNFLDYWRYGNHSTIASYHDNLVRSLAKEDAY